MIKLRLIKVIEYISNENYINMESIFFFIILNHFFKMKFGNTQLSFFIFTTYGLSDLSKNSVIYVQITINSSELFFLNL